MQDLIIQIFFFLVTFGILGKIAQWIGFLEKDEDTPDGTPAKPGFAWHFFKFLVVLILAFIVFVKLFGPHF